MNIFKSILKSVINPSTYRGSNAVASQLSGGYLKVFNRFFRYGAQIDSHQMGEFMNAYGSNPLLFMIVNKISKKVGSLPRFHTDIHGETLNNSKIAEFMEQPNSEQSGIDFYEQSAELLPLTGNLFYWWDGEEGNAELKILNPSEVEINCSGTGFITGYTYTSPFRENIQIDKDDILHVRTSNSIDVTGTSVKWGMSPLQAGWIIIKSSGEKFNAEASIFENRGIVGMLTSDGDVPMTKTERKRMQDEFDEEMGGSSQFNKIKISQTKLKFLQFGMSPTDLKLLESIESSLRQLSAMFGLSSIIFNDNVASTYGNIAEVNKSAYLDSYIPTAEKIDTKLSKFLSKKLKVNEKIKTDVTAIEVLKATTNENAQTLNSMNPFMSGKVMEKLTDNEIRDLLPNIEPIDGGDTIGGASENQNVNFNM